jgi:hypothetical protein
MNSYLVQNGQLFFAPFQVVLPDRYSVDPILAWLCDDIALSFFSFCLFTPARFN